MGHEQTAHPGTTPSDFLRHALSPSLESPGLCAFPPVETLWRNGACSPACGDAGCMGMRSPSNTKKPHWREYTVRYQPDHKHFKGVPETKRFETPYRSPQGRLWELDETIWHLAKRLPDYAPRRRRRKPSLNIQPPLLEESQGT